MFFLKKISGVFCCRFKFCSYFCSAKISMMVSPFRGASVIGSDIFRAFFMLSY